MRIFLWKSNNVLAEDSVLYEVHHLWSFSDGQEKEPRNSKRKDSKREEDQDPTGLGFNSRLLLMVREV